MKPVFIFLLAFPLSLSAQILPANQEVEVNTKLSDSTKVIWKKAIVTNVDTVTKKYSVKLADGSKMDIPATSPEKWIRPEAATLAEHFKDYNEIFVDYNSFKAQNGYEDPKIKGRFVYPYKIEMRVFLKRTVLFGGKAYYEYQTWEYDRVYEYATRGKKQCELYPVPANDAKMLSSGWYTLNTEN